MKPSQSGKKPQEQLEASEMSWIRVCIGTNVFLNALNNGTTHYSDSKEVSLSVEKGNFEAVIPTIVISKSIAQQEIPDVKL